MTDNAGRIDPQAQSIGTGTSMTSGIAWNAVALAFMALAGIGLNVAIGRAYGPAALGTFNIAFALYIFFAQIATFGLHLSILRGVSTASTDGAERLATVVYSGLVLCLCVAVPVTVFALVLTPVVVGLFPAVPDIGHAWLVAAPGLFAFALNKYLLAVVNGLQHMRAFAMFQSFRYVLILGVVYWLYANGVPSVWLSAALSIAELVLCLAVVTYVLKILPRPSWKRVQRSEISQHLRFGARVMPSGLVAELNTRIDVLMVGALITDKAAGIYSIAALIFEAALQAVMVVRNNLNPRLGRAIAEGRREEMLGVSRTLALLLTPLLAGGAVVVWFSFPYVAPWIFPGSEFSEIQAPLFWLLIAVPLAGAPLCYGLVLSIAGFPFWQSVQMLVSLAVAIVLAVVLIPWLGISGAAIAMAVSTCMTGLLGIWLVRRLSGIRIFF